MVQLINVLQNNSFLNPLQLPLLYGALATVEPGLMADLCAGRQAVRQIKML